jgi:hypothetical protein
MREPLPAMRRIGIVSAAIVLLAALGFGLRHWSARAANRNEARTQPPAAPPPMARSSMPKPLRPVTPVPGIEFQHSGALSVDWNAAQREQDSGMAQLMLKYMDAYRDLVARGHLSAEQQAKVLRLLLDAQMNQRIAAKAEAQLLFDRGAEIEAQHFGDPRYTDPNVTAPQAMEDATRELHEQHTLRDSLHSVDDQARAAARQALTPEQYRLFEHAFPLPSANVLPIR